MGLDDKSPNAVTSSRMKTCAALAILCLTSAGCSLITVPVKTVGSIVTTTVKTTGDIVTAPFEAVAGRRASSEDKPEDKKKKNREEERAETADYPEESRPAQPAQP
jgi:hypothetical protein